jgi:hypothetical protein
MSEESIEVKEQGIFHFRVRRRGSENGPETGAHVTPRTRLHVSLTSFSDPTGQSFCNDVATPSVEGLQEL